MSATAAPVSRSGTKPADRPRWWTYAPVASVSALVAGLIHLGVAPSHFAVAWYVGTFFVVVAAVQLGLAVMLLRPLGVRPLVAAIIANVAIVSLYVASRTVGLAFLPARGHGAPDHLPVAGGIGNGDPIFPGEHVEPVGVPDLVCLFAELLLIVMLAGLLPRRTRAVVANAMLALAVLALGARLGGLLG